MDFEESHLIRYTSTTGHAAYKNEKERFFVQFSYDIKQSIVRTNEIEVEITPRQIDLYGSFLKAATNILYQLWKEGKIGAESRIAYGNWCLGHPSKLVRKLVI